MSGGWATGNAIVTLATLAVPHVDWATFAYPTGDYHLSAIFPDGTAAAALVPRGYGGTAVMDLAENLRDAWIDGVLR